MKPEWGSKHECPGCGAHFYDMRNPEAACPKCNTPINDEAVLMIKKGAFDATDVPAREAKKDDPDDLEDIVIEDDLDLDDEDDDFIEDTSDLVGNDENDMSEIMEHIDEDTVDQNL